MSPYQCKLLGEVGELFSDITFTGNDDFPYLLNFVTLHTETLLSAEYYLTSKMENRMVCPFTKYLDKLRKLMQILIMEIP